MKAFNYNGQRNVSGERIRQERTRQRCTQSDLAARVQVSGVITFEKNTRKKRKIMVP